MNNELTQDELKEWSYLREQEDELQPKQQEKNQWTNEEYIAKQKAYLNKEIEKEEAEINEAFARHHLKNANNHLNKDAKEAISTLEQKENIAEQIKEKEENLHEYRNTREKREFLKDKLDGLDKNEDLKESLKILKEREEIDKVIKAKEEELQNIKANSNEQYQEKDSKKELEENKEKGEEVAEPSKEQGSRHESSAEQEDWDKRAKDLELQHEKELEELKDRQSRLEANFQKSIDNLMSSDGINGVLTALQEIDRSLEMMLKQGKEESEQKAKQRNERLELAFDSPKFKETVSDLVKEVYKGQKEVKGGFDKMQKESNNYVKLKESYEIERKKGFSEKGCERLQKMLDGITKETPNFKDSYPKFTKKVKDTLQQAKDKVLNKNQEQDKGRDI
ncbi:hypothetical protein JJB27_03765 [Campylobacter fetus subsp. venerealis]|uniref:hypothetical protein n=1 Tax=Campylobacter fetus TaxID=196 RepID=UPI000818822E|nr:hypothetical protein [Campylobacter fetus]MBK3498194.1 hypothetical protein [Campylobacter fetus subsp. venerealis]MBK3502175.1 hypothetical protein [Campylobacter fetus subsp. venerealis]OCS16828.1 hypothetical protein CfvWBT01109_01975 [Campylobacter fetus subsp. venerealis]